MITGDKSWLVGCRRSASERIVRLALPDGQVLTSIEFTPGEAVVKGATLDASQLALVSGKLSGRGYSARLDGDRLVVRAGNGL